MAKVNNEIIEAQKKTYSYAMCINSFDKFKKGEIYRIGYSSHYEDSFIDILEDCCSVFTISSYYPSIDLNTTDIDNFILITNVNISSIEVIKKIFDLLHD